MFPNSRYGFAMLATVLLSATLAAGLPMTASATIFPDGAYEVAQANCQAAAQQVVSQTGGQLLSVSPTGDGRCAVTVLVPGKGNERPRKTTVTVPAGDLDYKIVSIT